MKVIFARFESRRHFVMEGFLQSNIDMAEDGEPLSLSSYLCSPHLLKL